jgi:hypothetical protein
MITAKLVPEKQALIDTPEYENFGDSGFEKSILPVYSIAELLAGIVSILPAKHIVEYANPKIKSKPLIEELKSNFFISFYLICLKA